MRFDCHFRLRRLDYNMNTLAGTCRGGRFLPSQTTHSRLSVHGLAGRAHEVRRRAGQTTKPALLIRINGMITAVIRFSVKFMLSCRPPARYVCNWRACFLRFVILKRSFYKDSLSQEPYTRSVAVASLHDRVVCHAADFECIHWRHHCAYRFWAR